MIEVMKELSLTDLILKAISLAMRGEETEWLAYSITKADLVFLGKCEKRLWQLYEEDWPLVCITERFVDELYGQGQPMLNCMIAEKLSEAFVEFVGANDARL